MAIQQKEVTVLGETFLLTQFPAMRGTRILRQLIKLIGPAFAELQLKGEVAPALTMIFDNLDENTEKLIPELLSSASKMGMALNYEMEFAGAYDKMFLLAKEVVMFNYGSVFTLIGSDAQ